MPKGIGYGKKVPTKGKLGKATKSKGGGFGAFTKKGKK